MKKADLKELIKQTMMEVNPKGNSGKMTPQEEKMVADYEEEEANKHALDKEEPLEEAKVTPDNHVAYLANALQHVWEMGRGNNTVDFKDMAKSLADDMFSEESSETSEIPMFKGTKDELEDLWEVIKKTDMLIESWNKKK